ncbi:MAG: deaminase [Candidatus Saccharimonadales bacterium]
MNFDWNEVAFGSKKPLKDLQAIFIIAPRQLSQARLKQLIKTYLPKGNILLGIAKEPFVDGFEDQPQFRMLEQASIQRFVDQIGSSTSSNKLYTISYFQRNLPHVLEKLQFKHIVGINGSWRRSFHLRPEYYVLAQQKADYELVSPFVDELEAISYAADMDKLTSSTFDELVKEKSVLTESEMINLAKASARQSFDHSFQTGAVLGSKTPKGYKLLTTSYNRVVPYQTYAMLQGSEREKHFSPPNDMNFYDTVHAETMLLINSLRQNIKLADTTLFINLLPCPNCSRMLAETDITEVVFEMDHSDGFAIELLEKVGKIVRRARTNS